MTKKKSAPLENKPISMQKPSRDVQKKKNKTILIMVVFFWNSRIISEIENKID